MCMCVCTMAKKKARASQPDAVAAEAAGAQPGRAQKTKKQVAVLMDAGGAGGAGGELDYGMLHGHMESFTQLVPNNTQTVRSLCGSLHLTFLCLSGQRLHQVGRPRGHQLPRAAV